MTSLPLSTAQVRDLLGLRSDKRLNDLVRSGRVHPAPRVVSGRRFWNVDHVRQAAEALDLLTPDLRDRLACALDTDDLSGGATDA